MIRNLILISCASFVLTACVSPPLYLKMENGKLLQGTGMNGAFTVRDIDGYNCTGSYPIAYIMPTFDMPVTCSDGSTGSILMTMNPPDYDSGFGRGKLSNGVLLNAYFGAMKTKFTTAHLLKKNAKKD